MLRSPCRSRPARERRSSRTAPDEPPGVEVDTLEQVAIDPFVETRDEDTTVARCHVLEPVTEFDAGSDPSPTLGVVPTDSPVLGEVRHGALRVIRRA